MSTAVVALVVVAIPASIVAYVLIPYFLRVRGVRDGRMVLRARIASLALIWILAGVGVAVAALAQ